MGKLYAIDKRQLEAIKRIASRLMSMQRLTGDEARDLGKILDSIASDAAEMELPE